MTTPTTTLTSVACLECGHMITTESECRPCYSIHRERRHTVCCAAVSLAEADAIAARGARGR